MPIKGLTNEEHRNVLERLIAFAKTAEVKKLHPAGPEYTSLMVCFLTHCISSAESVLRLHDSFGDDYFPSTVGYTIVRPMFEIDVTAHYITQKPSSRAHQYIAYESILKKHQMDSWGKHRNSKKPDWREAMKMAWQSEWDALQSEINANFNLARSQFETKNIKGKLVPFRNWSGMSIKQMAIAVDHEEAYDVFYADLSSFAHADVRLVNRFLHLNSNGMSWSSRAHGPDIGGIFRYADIFFTCFLGLFGKEFKTWSADESRKCWD